MDRFDEILRAFEAQLSNAVKLRKVGKSLRIPTKPNALLGTLFANTVGALVEADVPFAIDYYGYIKRSTALDRLICASLKQLDPPRHIETIVVHFASLHVENIIEFAPSMVQDYIALKQKLLTLRGFKQRPQPLTGA